MSHTAFNYARDEAKKRGLKSSVRLTLYCLADRANKSGKAWPSLATLAEDTGKKRRQIIRDLSLLVDEGYISAKQTEGAVTVYTFPAPRVTHDTPPVSPMTQTRVTHDTAPVSPMTQTRVTHDTLSYKKPSRNQEETAPPSNSQTKETDATTIIQPIIDDWCKLTKKQWLSKNIVEKYYTPIYDLLIDLDWDAKRAYDLMVSKREEMEAAGLTVLYPSAVCDKIQNDLKSGKTAADPATKAWDQIVLAKGDASMIPPELRNLIRPMWGQISEKRNGALKPFKRGFIELFNKNQAVPL